MHPSIRLAAGLVIATVTSGLLALPPASAAHVARSGTTLHGFGDIVVDAAGGRVLVSQASGGPIVVMSSTGDRIGTIDGTSGASDLSLADDGSMLLAAYPTKGRIDVIDLSALGVIDSYATRDCPGAVARLGSTVFYGGPCPDSTGPSEIYALDPGTGESSWVGTVSSPS